MMSGRICPPAVRLIETFLLTGVAPDAGQRGLVSAGLSSGMANGWRGLVRALHDCFVLDRCRVHLEFDAAVKPGGLCGD